MPDTAPPRYPTVAVAFSDGTDTSGQMAGIMFAWIDCPIFNNPSQICTRFYVFPSASHHTLKIVAHPDNMASVQMPEEPEVLYQNGKRSMRILIVEDEIGIVKILEAKLNLAGFSTSATPSGEEAVALAKLYEYDLIVLDLNLPDICGLTVLRELRDAKVRTPVLVLSGSGNLDKMLHCFRLGADDFVAKPYRGDELVARIRAVVLRSNGHASPKVRLGDVMIELETKRVTVASQDLPLTRREYQILELLVMRKGGTVTKEAFLNHMYCGRDEPDEKIVDVYVCKLRKKIAALTRAGVYIETVWSRGYALHEAMHAASPCELSSVA